jgi:predicted outer membrane repeat protein
MRPASLSLARAVSVLFVLWGTSAAATTLYVAKSGDGSDGLSWETAFVSINEAIVGAATDDDIRVQLGTYDENIILSTPVKLIGGFSGRETSGKQILASTEQRSVIRPLLEGAVVEIVSDSLFACFEISGSFGLAGKGIRIRAAQAEVFNCISTSNQGTTTGAGMSILNSKITIRSCVFRNNLATGDGGGIACLNSQVRIVDCTLANNTVSGLGLPVPQSGEGGGLSITGGSIILSNCLFYGNTAGIGSDIYSYGYGAFLSCLNCTFGSVSYSNFNGTFNSSGVPSDFKNSVIWGHTPPFGGIPGIEAEFCLIRGGYPGDGNINEDPLFLDPDNGDFRLQPGSPCIDSASATGPAFDLDGNPRPIDVPGVGRDGTGDEFDMGAFEFTLLPTPAPTFVNERSDIDGSDRVDAKDLRILLGDWMKTTGS